MLLYTPLSAEEADTALSGRGLPDGDYFFVDAAQSDEVEDDAVWLAIDVSEAELASLDETTHELAEYREFRIASDVASTFKFVRVELG